MFRLHRQEPFYIFKKLIIIAFSKKRTMLVLYLTVLTPGRVLKHPIDISICQDDF